MKSIVAILGLSVLAAAQDVTVPTTCTDGFSAGTDTVIFTVPYTYTQVMSIIGSYKNLTWSGNPDDTVTLNGTDNTVGTARTYSTAGAHVIETILVYSKPPSPGPYNEVHNTALLTAPVPSIGNVTFNIPYDGTTVSSICGGAASTFNFTANYCAPPSNVTAAGQVLHALHSNDAATVGKFLGGQNFTGCAASANATATGSGAPAVYTGGAAAGGVGRGGVLAVVGGLGVAFVAGLM